MVDDSAPLHVVFGDAALRAHFGATPRPLDEGTRAMAEWARARWGSA